MEMIPCAFHRFWLPATIHNNQPRPYNRYYSLKGNNVFLRKKGLLKIITYGNYACFPL